MPTEDIPPNCPPYDTGKVRIGLAYERPKRLTMSADEERIQAALLGLEPRPVERISTFLSRRPWSTILVVFLLLMAVSLVKGGQA